jgi:hypothetical protein
LKKTEYFICNVECQTSLNILKDKWVSALIMVFTNLIIEFHVHVDAYDIALGGILEKLGEAKLDHIIYFSSINSQRLSTITPLLKEKD